MFVDSASYEQKVNQVDKTQLIISHVELGMKLAWKLLNSWQAKLPQDDVKSLVGISLCEAANNYDGRPNVQFQTFLYYYLRGRLLREITDSVKSRNIALKLSLSDSSLSDSTLDEELYKSLPIQEIKTAEDILINREEKDIIEESFDKLDDLEKEIVSRHYIEGESLIDIAKELGYCRCHLSRVKRRALSKLKKNISFKSDDKIEKSEEIFDSKIAKLESYTGGRGRRKLRNSKNVKFKLEKAIAA